MNNIEKPSDNKLSDNSGGDVENMLNFKGLLGLALNATIAPTEQSAALAKMVEAATTLEELEQTGRLLRTNGYTESPVMKRLENKIAKFKQE